MDDPVGLPLLEGFEAAGSVLGDVEGDDDVVRTGHGSPVVGEWPTRERGLQSTSTSIADLDTSQRNPATSVMRRVTVLTTTSLSHAGDLVTARTTST